MFEKFRELTIEQGRFEVLTRALWERTREDVGCDAQENGRVARPHGIASDVKTT